ncbi:uncharacterized protein [Prorops nasuta]|uniref:uncharacterized protein n=1 Tax=Prorops nasuta TaxID=863751 RepID=UPI0034CE76E2
MMRNAIVRYFVLSILVLNNHFLVLGYDFAVIYMKNQRNAMCVSLDDNSALIWNSEFQPINTAAAMSSSETQYTGFNCDFKRTSNCISSWEKTGWSYTNSLDSPMGPVLDKRWESFKQYEFLDKYERRYVQEVPEKGLLPVSLRTHNAVDFIFCSTPYYDPDLCYHIICDNWKMTKPGLRICQGEQSPFSNFDLTLRCNSYELFVQKYINDGNTAPSEWRTFILEWTITQEAIVAVLYDGMTNILSRETSDFPLVYDEMKNPLHLFVASKPSSYIRLHIYDYLYTTSPSTELTSPFINVPTASFCVEVLLGLQSLSKLQVVLKTSNSSKVVHISNDWTLDTVSDLIPIWKNLRFNITDVNESVQMQISINKHYPNFKAMAIGEIRECPPYGTVRYVAAPVSLHYNNELTCQKLSYETIKETQSISISQIFSKEPIYIPELSSCSLGKIGPECGMDCYNEFGSYLCNGLITCTKDFCSCPGYREECSALNRCEYPYYGMHCSEQIGFCYENNYNSITGTCDSGCLTSPEVYYVPPLCKSEIKSPSTPIIEFLNETYVRLSLNVKPEYIEIPTHYMFIICKTENITTCFMHSKYDSITKNTMKLEGEFNNLEPGVIYWTYCTLNIGENDTLLHSDLKRIVTTCTHSTDFEIDVYPCPDNWYKYRIKELDTNNTMLGSMDKFPFYIKVLPYTLYTIDINGTNEKNIVSKTIRTKEAPPSGVYNLSKENVTENELTLNWQKPLNPNGVIVRYEISLKLIHYKGCENNLPMNDYPTMNYMTNSTFIKLNLHPYTKYNVNVKACTVACGLEETFQFDSSEKTIPTSKFSNFKIRGNILSWDLPKNCQNVTGRISAAKLIINGLSENVKNYKDIQEIKNRTFELGTNNQTIYGAETYRARLYILRDLHEKHNETAFAELSFTTEAKPPPAVRSLEVVEFDSVTRMITLRWQEPKKPINGEIKYYAISNKTPLTRIYSKETCKPWKNYYCATVKQQTSLFPQFSVKAFNKGISQSGPASTVSIENCEFVPSEPQNFTVIPLEAGLLNITWIHPSISGGRIKEFSIIAIFMNSDLLDNTGEIIRTYFTHEITEYKIQYDHQIRLLPSSEYIVSIHAVTIYNEVGHIKNIDVQTPASFAFETPLNAEVIMSESIIHLHVPRIINNTKHSIMNIIVKGGYPCKQHKSLNERLLKEANVEPHEYVWIAATGISYKFANKVFIVGDNRTYNDAINCPLQAHHSYTLIVTVHSHFGSIDDRIIIASTKIITIVEVPKVNAVAWLILPLSFVFIFGILIYSYRKYSKSFNCTLMRGNDAFPNNTKRSANISIENIVMNEPEENHNLLEDRMHSVSNDGNDSAEQLS